MPATAARIGFISEQYRTATAGPVASVAALYGNAARDTLEPLETYFDSQADAEAMADERLELLKVQRSLVTASIAGLDDAQDIDFSLLLPTVRVLDDEQERNSRALVVGVGLDLKTGRSSLDTWG